VVPLLRWVQELKVDLDLWITKNEVLMRLEGLRGKQVIVSEGEFVAYPAVPAPRRTCRTIPSTGRAAPPEEKGIL
jgi:hypothetical protein